MDQPNHNPTLVGNPKADLVAAHFRHCVSNPTKATQKKLALLTSVNRKNAQVLTTRTTHQIYFLFMAPPRCPECDVKRSCRRFLGTFKCCHEFLVPLLIAKSIATGKVDSGRPLPTINLHPSNPADIPIVSCEKNPVLFRLWTAGSSHASCSPCSTRR